MSKAELMRGPRLFAAILVAAALIGAIFAGSTAAGAAGGACALVANEHDPSVKILRCGDNLTVHVAPGSHYRLIAKPGQPLPSAIQLNDGALLIEFQPSPQQKDFQILTPLAVAAVRGTKWAVEVSAARTSTLVLGGAVAVTNRHLNQYVILREGEGADITPMDTSLVQKRWGDARVRALLARFGE